MIIIAKDEKGNEFKYDVKLSVAEGKKIVDFGYPIQYYLDDLMQSYPRKGDFCIDGAGRNHKGSPVWVSKKDMNKILQEFQYKGIV